MTVARRVHTRRASLAASCLALGLALAAPASAQSPSQTQAQSPSQVQGCTVTNRSDPAGQVIACPGGLTLTVEPATAYRLIDADGDGRPEAAELTDRGLLVEVPPGRGRVRFQIRTPHAVASVRGTVWATDVSAARTSVFVERGAVAVRPQASRRTAVLNPGEGVDVEAGTRVPEVKRWSPARAAALLARFRR
ncbi:MAG TPA: FecR domain-containing protein [Microvirga sp.]|jgi:ferric-dicitrate binding protein FerR (iron transport regulator)|nr:FecR domain-containing protein [Microvirga sp.]